jgi:polyhydroxybutyrate depolymerase
MNTMQNKILKTILIILLILAVLVLAAIVVYRSLNKTNGAITSSGETRKYLLYVPESYDPSKPTPLVLSFHGFIDWPAHHRDMTHWNEVADEHGFIVVYPSGTGLPLRWRAYEQPAEDQELSEDVQFISDLIDKLQVDYNIDPQRIYANGMSNGGGMTFLLSCQLSDRIAAIGGVAGAYMTPWEACAPSRPVPGIFFHGTADTIVPYDGGFYERSGTPFPVIPEWVKQWATINGCNLDPQEIPRVEDVSGVKYETCNRNAQVILYTIHEGGHTWPGGEPLPERITGTTTQNIDATREMWAFYMQHRLDD